VALKSNKTLFDIDKFSFAPGDLIEWVYMSNNELVAKNEELWSRIDNAYVPIGRNLVHMCISVDNDVYSWLNEKGLFRARSSDIESSNLYFFGRARTNRPVIALKRKDI